MLHGIIYDRPSDSWVSAFGARWDRLRRSIVDAQPTLAELRRIMPLALCVASLMVLAIGIYQTRGLTDDGLIHLRVVQQWRTGNGLDFNVGERVEVSSSPLWVVAIAIADLLIPMRLESLTMLLSGAFVVVGVALVMRAAFRDAAARGGRAMPGLAITFALLPATWRWSTTGMENGLIIAWIGICWYLARRSSRERSLDAVYALVIGFGPLIRQDYVLACMFLIAAALWSVRKNFRWRSALGFVAVSATPALLYQVFRMAYFGLLVPNPTVAKYLGSARWSRGWRWFTDSISAEGPRWSWWVVLLLIAVAIGMAAKADRVCSAAFVLAGTAMVIPAIAAGGDFMDVRFVVPAMFAAILPAAMFIVPPPTRTSIAAPASTARPGGRAFRGTATRQRPRLFEAASLVAVALTFGLVFSNRFWHPPREVFMTESLRSLPELAGLIDLDGGRSVDDNPAAYFLLKRQEDIVMNRQTYVSIGIGGISAYRPLRDRIYDQLGLANPIGSHMMPAIQQELDCRGTKSRCRPLG